LDLNLVDEGLASGDLLKFLQHIVPFLNTQA